jgi:adenine-specific DNA-methyltransferase
MSKQKLPEAAKLEKLLRELFQLDDAAKLDFGIYRILAQRLPEMRAFLAELVDGIPARLGEAAGGERERLKEELERYERQRVEMGDDLDEIRASKRYQELATKVEAALDVRDLARDVFRDLYAFFSRYWDEGDFMAVPRYDRDTYAIPYDGSEVALHWANRDQYYVKSTLFFNDMTVKDARFPGRLRFELAAAVADRDNTKGTGAKKRRFMLADEDEPVFTKGKDLVVRLRYGPFDAGEETDDDESDSDEDTGETTTKKRETVPRQDKLDTETATRILDLAPVNWQMALGRETDGDSEILRRLRRYTKGNSADFFIHKNLRKFLRREIDFFIKNEVFDLDNIDQADLATLDGKLRRVKALRALAHDLIDWLHQVEDFQRRLFLKKKFVLRTDWAVTLDRVPRELWPEIAANERQVARWQELFGVELGVPAEAADSDGVRANYPYALIETHLFSDDFTDRLVSIMSGEHDLSELTCATLVHSENHAALRLLDESYRGSVRTVYIDPPYNTGQDGFLYKDTYKSSCWLTMVRNRLEASVPLLSGKGVVYVSINEIERDGLVWQLGEVFGFQNRVEELIWTQDTVSNNAPAYSTNHEYVEAYARNRATVEADPLMFRATRPGFTEVMEVVEDMQGEFPPVSDVEEAIKALYKKHKDQNRADAKSRGVDVKEADRADLWKGLYPYKQVEYRDASGRYVHERDARTAGATLWVWREVEPSMPSGKQSSTTKDPTSANYRYYRPPHPSTGRPCTPPKRGWAFPRAPMDDRPSYESYLADHRISFRSDEKGIPQLKYFLHEVESVVATSVFRQYADGEPHLERMFGRKGLLDNPKPPGLVERLVIQTTDKTSIVLDFFGGSGTTGEAVLRANRADGGSRRSVLVEMGEHFDTVLVPRILKATYSKDWKDGKPVDRQGLSALYKIIHLESYDDSLENITLDRPDERQEAMFGGGSSRSGVGKDYLLHYMLHMEAGRSLLDKDRFGTPFDYRIRAFVTHRDQSGASWSNVEEVPVDLVETFNYLLGLRVKAVQPLGRDGDMQVARYVEGVRRGAQGDWSIKTLVVWRDVTKVDDAALDELFARAQFTEERADGRRYIADFDEVYVNGDNRLPNQRREDERWRVTLIEEEFHRLMFDVPEEA